MKLETLNELGKKDKQLCNRIKRRQQLGTMKKYLLNGYVAYDKDELATWTEKQRGRKAIGCIEVNGNEKEG